ncbi:Rieske (2Fe-2S) protein [Streptomyces sp. HNM0574]|uniref:Rieske (2Fe-2S) protein n=1 Tax=Streptomyces sp. HNM0574 TaxID=2714954 RepID=UPI0019D2370B|nr:Rieske (2Fe-2S) protein [Streptomyces sp. HNM0574]
MAATACGGAEDDGQERPGGEPTPTAPVDLGPADAVPVGGAKLYRERKLVVSQPSRGEFKAFSAVCTHRGCVLTKVEKQEGDCTCHGSRFDVTNGEVLQGPASVPLPSVPVTERGGKLVAGPEGDSGRGA